MPGLELEPIGVVRSPYGQKLGIPRQAGLASAVVSRIELDPERVGAQSTRGLDRVSHLWLIFGFSEHYGAEVRDTVRPPRLGGETRLGVFATRSPFRPNPLGLSVVELVSVHGLVLEVRGADVLDGTPVYDLKPYLPWAESLPEARCDWADSAPLALEVEFSDRAESALASQPEPESLRRVLVSSLQWDPRPAWERAQRRQYRTRMAGFDITFSVADDVLEVVEISAAGPLAP